MIDSEVYEFGQYYEGIPTNLCIKLFVAGGTQRVEALVCGYHPSLPVDPEPAVPAEDALAAAQQEFPEADFKAPELFIEVSGTDNARLLWKVCSRQGHEVHVSAENGSVLYAFDGIYE